MFICQEEVIRNDEKALETWQKDREVNFIRPRITKALLTLRQKYRLEETPVVRTAKSTGDEPVDLNAVQDAGDENRPVADDHAAAKKRKSDGPGRKKHQKRKIHST